MNPPARTNRTAGWLLGVGRDERGASLALVAISLLWIVGLASLVLDLGNGWLDRQRLIPATDAAALAAAQDLIDNPWDTNGACASASAYVAGNLPTAVMTECTISSSAAGAGRVTVAAREQLDGVLSDFVDNRSVASTSTVTWGSPITVSGLRPLSLCYDGSAALREVIDNPPSGPTWVVIPYPKDDPEACGGAQSLGNYATIDFEGGTPMSEIRDWTVNGYPGQVSFGSPTDTGCIDVPGCYDRPYASNDIKPELYTLKHRQDYVPWPVFDYSDDGQVHVIGIVRARLYAFDLNGPTDGWTIELKVDPGLVSGTCCGPATTAMAGSKAMVICGVDPESYAACPAGSGT